MTVNPPIDWERAVVERVEAERERITGQQRRKPRVIPPPEERSRIWELLERARTKIPAEEITVDTEPGQVLPGYPLGLPELDGFTESHGIPGGGGYGLTAIVGDPKAKKSVLASNMAAIESARVGWHVRVVSFELTATEVLKRAAAYFDLQLGQLGLEAPQWFRDRWRVLDCTDPDTMSETVTKIQASLPPYEVGKLLLVVDSVSRFADDADYEGKGDPYFANLKLMWRFMRRLVKLSEGDVSCIGVVEFNQRRGDKGGSAAYACNLMLKLAKGDDGLVEISMPHSRDTPIPKPIKGRSGGSFGKFYLQPDRWRLAKWEEVGVDPIREADVDDRGEEF